MTATTMLRAIRPKPAPPRRFHTRSPEPSCAARGGDDHDPTVYAREIGIFCRREVVDAVDVDVQIALIVGAQMDQESTVHHQADLMRWLHEYVQRQLQRALETDLAIWDELLVLYNLTTWGLRAARRAPFGPEERTPPAPARPRPRS